MRHLQTMLIVTLVLFFSVPLLAKEETVKIVKIIDANLFQTDDGRLIRLALIKTPSISDDDPVQRYLAQTAVNYAKNMLLDKEVVIRYDSSMIKKGAPISVYLYKKYPLEKLDIIKVYLKRGYAKYNPPKDYPVNKTYLAAQQTAKQHKLGIWKTGLIHEIKTISFKSFRFMYGKKNIFENIVAYRSVVYRVHSETARVLFDLRLGIMENAQKYTGSCEYSNSNFYTERLRHFKTGFVQVMTGRNWKGLTLALGGLGGISTKDNYCSEVSRFSFFSPIIIFKYQLPQQYYAQIALNDAYSLIYVDYPLILKIGKDFNFLHSRLWLGTVKEIHSFGALAGLRINLGPTLIGADFGYKPNGNKWFTRFEIGLY